MHQREFADTGKSVSEIGLGCWQLGSDWGEVVEEDALAILTTAVDNGITFIDTADVYGDGRSERLIGQFLRNREEDLFVATKVGRKNFPGPYTPEVLRKHIDDCRSRLGVDSLDLAQFSQRWILDHDAVSTVITGASRATQVIDNAATSECPSLSPETHARLKSIYESEIREHIRGIY